MHIRQHFVTDKLKLVVFADDRTACGRFGFKIRKLKNSIKITVIKPFEDRRIIPIGLYKQTIAEFKQEAKNKFGDDKIKPYICNLN